MEKEREDDIRERDAFAKRMQEKDKEKTRQIMSKTDKKVDWFLIFQQAFLSSILCFIFVMCWAAEQS